MEQNVELVIVGSVGIDEITTPLEKRSEVPGGAATHASAAASFFAPTGLVGVVGEDFPATERARLERFGVDLAGLQQQPGKTFRWSGVYEDDFVNRRTLSTELGVFADFRPELPPHFRRAGFLLLGNISPELQLLVLDQMPQARFVAVDTMDLWINIARDKLLEVIRRTSLLTVNDAEARLLTGCHNLRDCAARLLELGPQLVVIKKGEHGSMLFAADQTVLLPAYPVREVIDPTGAGDTFAGACLGYLASCGATRLDDVVRGLQYGATVASFGVEAFGLEGLEKIGRAQIEKRMTRLHDMYRSRPLAVVSGGSEAVENGEKKTYRRVLTIAGSDSGGGAGIQADLKTFSALGCYGMSVICALTAQNTRGVTAIHDVPAGFVGQQIDAVLEDIGVDAVKIGMLQSPEVVRTVAARLQAAGVEKIVVDPVMVAKSGHKLLQDDAVEAVREVLLPLASVITPNLPEAEVLTGRRVTTEEQMLAAAEQLVDMGAGAALVKGGHLEGRDCNDCLVVREPDGSLSCTWLYGERVETVNTHGTGCTLSSAIAAFLARGFSIKEAVKAGKTYLTTALRAGAAYQIGSGHGPVHHFAGLWGSERSLSD